MPIGPKYTTNGYTSKSIIPRQFTDRKDFISLFINTLSTGKNKENRIKFFYGVGGVGKTALKNKFIDIIKTLYPESIWNEINLEENIFRDSDAALFQLRSNLKELYKINFPFFDVAYYYLIKKTRPHLIPKISEKILFDSISDELIDIPNLEPSEISARLPALWAHDVKLFLKNNILVLFVDSYDEFLKDSYLLDTNLRQDEWLRELVLNLPEAKWIMFGREKLRWEEIDSDWCELIDYHLLDNFGVEDAKDFLESCKIKDKNIQSIIIENSKGLPYYLDLAVDTYYEIKNEKKRIPVTEDFAKTQQQVLVNFLKYLDNKEIYTLKVLSVTRFWDKNIFINLLKKFNIPFPILEMNRLFRFSFVKERMQEGYFDMHELMREGLQNIIDKELLRSVHMEMYEYHRNKLERVESKNITDKEKQSFIEAFYHGKNVLEPLEFSKWVTEKENFFWGAAEHKFITTMYEELLNIIENSLGSEHFEIANILKRISFFYILEGKFIIAEKYLNKALRIREQVFGKEHNEVANILNSIATLYSRQGKYKEEEKVLEKALRIKLKLFDSEHFELIETYRLFASLYDYMGIFEKAEIYFKKTINLTEKKHGKNNTDLGTCFSNLGVLYGKSSRYAEAESLYLKALEIYQKNVSSKHNYLMSTLINLANLYFDMEKYSDAEELYIKSLNISEKIFGANHTETATILNNIGNLFLMQKRYSDAKPYYEKSLKINEKFFGSSHPEVAATSNNLAYLYYLMDKDKLALHLYQKAYKIFRRKLGYNHLNISNIMGNVAAIYRKNKEFDKAEKLLTKALKINETVLGIENQFVGKTYKDFGDLFETKSDLPKSLAYYSKAYPILLKSLGESHQEVTDLSNKISDIKIKIQLRKIN